MLGHVDEQLGGRLSDLDPNDPQSLSTVGRARIDSRTAKELLSHDVETVIPVTVGGTTSHVTLTRAQLEQLIRPRVIETVDALRARRRLGRLDHGGHRPGAAGRRELADPARG